MNTIIKDAIANSSYELHYQPKLDVKSGDIVGVECLARLKLYNGEILQPKEFMDMVYGLGMNANLFKFVLNQSIRDVLMIGVNVTISINLKCSDIINNDITMEGMWVVKAVTLLKRFPADDNLIPISGSKFVPYLDMTSFQKSTANVQIVTPRYSQ